MKTYHRFLATALVAGLLAVPAAPVFATPADHDAAPTGGFASLTSLWDRLAAPFLSLFDGADPGSAGTTPTSTFDQIGCGADPDGTPCPESTSTSTSSTDETELPSAGSPLS